MIDPFFLGDIVVNVQIYELLNFQGVYRSEKTMKRVFLGVDGSLTRVHHLDRWEASGSVEGTHPSSLTQPTCNSWEVRI